MKLDDEHIFSRVSYLMSRDLGGVMTESERAELARWMAGQKRYSALYRNVREWMKADRRNDWEEAFGRFERRRRSLYLRRRWGRIAGVAAAVMIGFGSWNMLWNRMPEEWPLEAEITVPAELPQGPRLLVGGAESIALSGGEAMYRGGQDMILLSRNDSAAQVHAIYSDTLVVEVPACCDYHFVLEDGTRVWMNADSKLIYPARFRNDCRVIRVEGEVFLEVARESERPFRVETGKMNIEVLGTSFNINDYDGLVVTLATGKIRATGKNGYVGEWLLEPGQQLRAEGQQVTAAEVKVDDYISWRKGYYIFREEQLGRIAGTIQRWYGNEVIFLNEAAGKESFTGILHKDEGIEVFLKRLSESSSVECILSDRQLFIK